MKKILLMLSLALTFTISATYDDDFGSGFDDGFSSTTQGFGDDCNDSYSAFSSQCENDPYSNRVERNRDGTISCTVGPCRVTRLGPGRYRICDTGDGHCDTVNLILREAEGTDGSNIAVKRLNPYEGEGGRVCIGTDDLCGGFSLPDNNGWIS